MPTTTRRRLVETAQRRFYRDGFRNVGLEQILSDVGITKTAFYKHFKCKEDLMLEVLEHQNREMQSQFMGMIRTRAGHAAARQLYAIFDMVQHIISSDGFQGCIFVNAALEFPLPHDPVFQAAQRNKRAVEQIIHDIAERAGAANPEALAQELCLIMEGAYITSMVTANPQTINIARRLGHRAIDVELTAQRKRVSARRKRR